MRKRSKMWRCFCDRVNECGMIEIDCYDCPSLSKLDEDFYNSIDIFNKILKMNTSDTSDLKNLFGRIDK